MTAPWQLLFWALVALAVTSMSQPSFVNRYVNEELLYFAHSSPFVAIADAIDLMLRASVFFVGYKKLPLRHAMVLARESFDSNPEEPLRRNDGRSILLTWLFFFLSAVGPAGKVVDITGIPGTKAVACLYAISIVIRSAFDVVRTGRVWSDAFS